MNEERAVAVIGMGRLGRAVATRLASAGFEVAAFDAEPARLAALPGTGVQPVRTAAEAWRAQRVLLALPDDAQTGAALAAATGWVGAGTVAVDLHAGDPRSAERAAALLESAGAALIDAPLAGSIAQIERGDAVALIGGHPEALARCDDLWPVIARERFVFGGSGRGQAAMLAINLVLGLNRAALAEGMAFAEALGFDATAFVDLLRATPAYSRAVDAKGERMSARNYAPDTPLRLQRDELQLIRNAAAHMGGRLPLAEALAALLEEAIAAGEGSLDSAAVVEPLRRRFKGTSKGAKTSP